MYIVGVFSAEHTTGTPKGIAKRLEAFQLISNLISAKTLLLEFLLECKGTIEP